MEDRNHLLAEAARKFNLLRDDFQFNLTLLEARDNEIIRLNQVEQNLLADLETKEREIKTMFLKIEKLQTKEAENYEKHQHEKNKTQVSCCCCCFSSFLLFEFCCCLFLETSA